MGNKSKKSKGAKRPRRPDDGYESFDEVSDDEAKPLQRSSSSSAKNSSSHGNQGKKQKQEMRSRGADDDGDIAPEQDGLDYVDDGELMNIDFEHYDLQEGDFHCLKTLLRMFLGGHMFDISGLVDILVKQGKVVGTAQKSSGDEDAYSFISAISIQKHADKSCMQDIIKVLTKSVPKQHQQSWQSAVGESGRTALLVTGRLINMPEQMSLPLYVAVLDEINWATQDLPSTSARKEWEFDNILLVSPLVKDESGAPFHLRSEEEALLSKAKWTADVVGVPQSSGTNMDIRFGLLPGGVKRHMQLKKAVAETVGTMAMPGGLGEP